MSLFKYKYNMKNTESKIIKKYFKNIEFSEDGFYGVFRFFAPKWFRFLNYLTIISLFWYLAKLTNSYFLYAIALISMVIILISILGFIDTNNYLVFESSINKQFLGYILFVLPLFALFITIIILIVEALAFQFG